MISFAALPDAAKRTAIEACIPTSLDLRTRQGYYFANRAEVSA